MSAGTVLPRIVVLTAGLRQPSSSRLLADRLASAVGVALTERGRTLQPVLLALKAWGDAHGEVAERTAAAA